MYTPVISFSICSRASREKSGMFGMGGGGASCSSIMPNSEIWPATLTFWVRAAPSMARS